MIGQFFYGECFYECIDDFLHEEAVFDLEDLNDRFSNDWSIEVELAELRPIFQFDAETMLDWIQQHNEHEFPEDYDNEMRIIEKLLPTWFNFELANSQVPCAWYESGKKDVITKDDLIQAL